MTVTLVTMTVTLVAMTVPQMVPRSMSFKKASKSARTPLTYTMAVFHNLKTFRGLEGIDDDRLWLLAQVRRGVLRMMRLW